MTGGIVTAITFQDFEGHDDVARRNFIDGKATSAGFFHVNYERKIETYGESVSLKLKPAPGDAKLIARATGLHEDSF